MIRPELPNPREDSPLEVSCRQPLRSHPAPTTGAETRPTTWFWDADLPVFTTGTPTVRGHRQRTNLIQSLSALQLELLNRLAKLRYATTNQLLRTIRPHYTHEATARRCTTRALRHLADHALTEYLPRQIGGRKAGSASTIWTISPIGRRLIDHHHGRTSPKYCKTNPSWAFLDHTLATTEIHTQLIDLHHQDHLTLIEAVGEPDCWRTYLGPHGTTSRLKPDLYAITETTNTDGTWRDHWFIEIDRNTETPARILTKCHQYQHHATQGTEQATHGVYPHVLWITPSIKRAEQLTARLAEDSRLIPELFTVIHHAQFTHHITHPSDDTT